MAASALVGSLVASVLVVVSAVVGVGGRVGAAPGVGVVQRLCPGDVVLGGAPFGGGSQVVSFAVPADAQPHYEFEVQLLERDPDFVARMHFVVEQVNEPNDDVDPVVIDRVRDGSQSSPVMVDRFLGDVEPSGQDRVLVLEVGEVEGRPVQYSMTWDHDGAVPAECGVPVASEDHGRNVSVCRNDAEAGDPVDTRTGNWHLPLGGLVAGGRGPGLGFEVAYNSLEASSALKAGRGWSSTLDMAVVGSGLVRTVVQENGATVPFVSVGAGWAAPARFVRRWSSTGMVRTRSFASIVSASSSLLVVVWRRWVI